MLSKRLISSVLLWSCLLGVIFYLPPLASALFCSLISLLALWEFYDMLQRGGLKCAKVWGIFAGITLTAGTWYFSSQNAAMTNTFEVALLVSMILGLFCRQLFDKNNPDTIQTISHTLLGIVYIPWLFNFFAKIKYFYPIPPDTKVPPGALLIFLLVVVTKCCDMGAYLVGRMFGRHRMMPRISPNKTWEGIIGGFVFAIAASVSVFSYIQERVIHTGLNYNHAVILGILLGVMGIIGDLCESMIKRQTHVKDSGEMLPGIGGILDLIDSLLFTAPVMYAYLVFFVKA